MLGFKFTNLLLAVFFSLFLNNLNAVKFEILEGEEVYGAPCSIIIRIYPKDDYNSKLARVKIKTGGVGEIKVKELLMGEKPKNSNFTKIIIACEPDKAVYTCPVLIASESSISEKDIEDLDNKTFKVGFTVDRNSKRMTLNIEK